MIKVDGNKEASAILYVLDEEHGERVSEIVQQHNVTFNRYYSGRDSVHLDRFKEGKIDTISACERLNQGIDILNLNNIFLISVDRARLKTIQRIGRCLRKNPSDPDKKPLVVDFILKESNNDGSNVIHQADFHRYEWLSKLAAIRKNG